MLLSIGPSRLVGTRPHTASRPLEASRPSRLLFFLAHALRIAPTGIFLRALFNIWIQPISCRCSGAVVEVVRAAQLSVDDAAPARHGHHRDVARHLRQPDPRDRRAFVVWGQQRSQPALVWGQQLLQRKRLQKAAGGERIDANQARPLSLAIRAEGGRAV